MDLYLNRRTFTIAGAAAAVGLTQGCAQDDFTAGAASPMPARSGTATGSVATMSAFDSLTSDHRQIDQLFAQIQSAPTAQQRAQLFTQLKKSLDAHALAEENIVYPALVRIADEEGEAGELFQDHAEMKVAMFELEALPKDSPQWMSRLNALREDIRSHVQAEEANAFPALQQALNPQQIQELSQLVQREKSRLG